MWNSAQCYVTAWTGREFGGEWIYVYVWLSPFTVHLKLPQHSVQFSRSVVSDSLRAHESQHTRPPCPSPTHVQRVGDAIQPSHPLSSPSPPAPNLSQHQSLFQWVNSLHEVAKVLEFQLQHRSLQRTPRTDLHEFILDIAGSCMLSIL